jgi:hypothetical protein
LLGDTPLVEDDHVRGHLKRLALIVGHIQDRDAQPTVQLPDLASHLGAQARIEIGERLIEQQDRRFHRKASRERHALLLAPRELMRKPRRELTHPDQLERFPDPALPLGGLDAMTARAQRICDVIGNSHVGPDGVGLKHHA